MSMEILNQWADEPVPLVTCESHVFQAWMTTGRGVSYRCVTCGRIALDRDPASPFTPDGLLEQNPYRASIEQTEVEDDNEMCQRCSGTGLGQREGGHCASCDGTGIAGYHWAGRGEERW